MEDSERYEGGGSSWTGTDGRSDSGTVERQQSVTESPMIKMIDFVTINNYPVSGNVETSSVSSLSRYECILSPG